MRRRDVQLDEVKQTPVEPWQSRSSLVCYKSALEPTTDNRTVNRRGCSRPSEIRPWPWYLHRFWPGHEDTCETNSIAMFCCTTPTTSDPPLGAANHVLAQRYGSLGHRTALRQSKCRPKYAGDGRHSAITKSTERERTFTILFHNKLILSVDCSSSRC